MVIIQSYSSPEILSEDKNLYAAIKRHIKEIHVVYRRSVACRELRIKDFLKPACKANFVKTGDGLIMGWGGDCALYSWLMGRLLFRKRVYLSQNLIVDDQMATHGDLKNKIRYLLYKIALKSRNFYVTVNSRDLVGYYSALFDCNSDRFYCVYDSMSVDDSHMAADKIGDNSGNYIFCGGRAQRDVATFLKIVEMLPERQFICVFPKTLVNERMVAFPNLKVYSDLSKDEFNSILDNSYICCIPLKSQAPCGLLVMQRAAIQGIPIVSTETSSMRTVVPDDKFGFLLPMKDAAGMADAISILYRSPERYREISENEKRNAENFAPEKVGLRLSEVIKELSNINRLPCKVKS